MFHKFHRSILLIKFIMDWCTAYQCSILALVRRPAAGYFPVGPEIVLLNFLYIMFIETILLNFLYVMFKIFEIELSGRELFNLKIGHWLCPLMHFRPYF